MDYIPIHSTQSPRLLRWSYWLLSTGFVALLLVVAMTLLNVLPNDTWLYTPVILSMSLGLYLYWEVG